MKMKPATKTVTAVVFLTALFSFSEWRNAYCQDDKDAVVEFSLQDCMKLAVQNNFSILIAQNNLELSREDIEIAMSVFDPVFYTKAGYADNISPSTNPFITGADKLESSGIDSQVGIQKKFAYGTSLDVFFSSGENESNSQWLSLNPSWDSAVGVKLSQALLKGSGRDYNMSASAIAENTRQMAAYDFSAQMISLLYDTQVTYWNLIDAINQKKVRDKMLESARKLLEINRAKEAAHTISPVEVLQAEAHLATQEEAILLAEKAILDIEDQLKRIIFPPHEAGVRKPEMNGDRRDISSKWDIRIIPVTPVDFAPVEVDVNGEIAKAFENRPDYLKMKKEAENSEITLSAAKNELLPSLDLSAGYQLNGLEGSFGKSAGDVFSENNRNWEIGISFQIPIGNRSAKSNMAKADIAKRSLLLQIKDAEQQIITDVRRAVREIETMYKRVSAAQKSLELAQKQLEAEMKRLDNGQSTTYNVLEFQKALRQAESNYYRAIVDYDIAKLNLAKSTGTLK